MEKSILLPAFFLLFNFLFAQNDLARENSQHNSDSLFFVKTKAAFAKFEQAHGHYIQTNNVKMHYLTWGKPTGVPLIWAHGTGSHAYEMMGFADSLAKQGYYVISIDYYGHGFTPIPEKDVSLYHVADDIKFLLNHLNIKKTVIGGWSRGGSVATAFYDAYKENVLGLILEDGGAVSWSTNDHKLSIDSLTKKITTEFAGFEAYQSKSFNSQFEAIKWTGDSLTQKNIFMILASLKENANGKWAFNPGLSSLCAEDSVNEFLCLVHRPFASSRLFAVSTELMHPGIIYRNLNVPMLIFDPISKNDNFDFEEGNRKLQMAHPGFITHKIYKNTSHAVKWDRPTEFLQDLRLFLSKINVVKGNKQ